jgi:hypothetical protein
MSHRITSTAVAAGFALSSALAVGAFSLPAQGAVPGTGSAGRSAEVACVGSSTSCTASVSLAGGASNKTVVVALPASGLRLVSAMPSSPNLDGAYLVSDQAMKAGGRRYTFTLNAAEAPAGSKLRFTFRKPGSVTPAPTILRCTGAMACTVKVPLGGGASNRHVVVQLPRVDLGLISVKPSSPVLKGAYSVSDQHLRKGHSEYEFVLNAVESTPAGSYLTMTFAANA